MASESRFLIDLRLGPRTLETACELVASVAMLCCRSKRLLNRLLLLIDDHLPYPNAILRVFGVIRHRRRKGGRGRLKHPDLKAPPGLLAGVVEKIRDAGGKLLGVRNKALFGCKRQIIRVIRQLGIGRQINTAHVERLNGTIRTQQARLTRRTRAMSRLAEALQWSLWIWRDAYNWIHVHGSLQGRTPAMALGLAQEPWNMSRYVQHPVHVSDWQHQIWVQEREILLTSPLGPRKCKKRLPTS